MFDFLAPLRSGYRSPARSTRQRDRHADLCKRLCAARRDDPFQSDGGGSVDAPGRMPRTTAPAAKKTKSGDDDGGGADGDPERHLHLYIPSERLLRLPQVLDTVGLGKTLLYELVKDGAFPRPRKVRHLSVWVESEVQTWICKIAGTTDA